MTNFDSTKMELSKFINQIKEGIIQLPDFQRGWVWDEEHVLSLLASIARSFPIGAVMLLENGGDTKFQVRPIENVVLDKENSIPDKLILDGQQRLTTLTQVLGLKKPVKTYGAKNRKINRYYYIDIKKALEEDSLDDAFFGIDEDKILKSNFGRTIDKDLSTVEKEYEEFCFPCNQILNSDEWEEGLQAKCSEKFSEYMKFRKEILSNFRGYQIPLISLSKETPKEAVCIVFEKVNTGGMSLSVFELVTASFAADNYNLRDDWYGSSLRNMQGRLERLVRHNILSKIEPTDFLQAITLLHTHEKRMQDLSSGKNQKMSSAVSAKRASILSLNLDIYNKWSDKVEQGFVYAAQFMRRQCFYNVKDLPYRSQLVPLAAILSLIEERYLEPQIYDKLSQWFWCGILGELYGGAVETRIANDVEELYSWILNSTEEPMVPRTVSDATFSADRLKTLKSRLSAAYKGLNILILRNGAKDFFWKSTVQDLDHEEVGIDIHHIFPQDWCEKQGIKRHIYDSALNKTPISYKANRMIGGNAPSLYMQSLQTHPQVQLDDYEMNKIIKSHYVDPATLRSDDFELFLEKRGQYLIQLIENAMNKNVIKQFSKNDYNTLDEEREFGT